MKITKQALLPESQSTQQSTYYSKVAEVNERGELSGDETTQSGTSHSDEDDENGEDDDDDDDETLAPEAKVNREAQELIDEIEADD